MKVVRINAVYGIRSTGGFVKEIHEAALQEKHDSYVFVSDVPETFRDTKNVSSIGSKLDHKIHALLSRVSGLQGYYSRRSTRRLLNSLAEIEPEVVHLHNLHSNYINLRMLFGFLSERDIPTVITLHDCWLYTGKCTHYSSSNCYKWMAACGNCPKLKDDNKSWFFDKTSKLLRDKKELFDSIPRLAVIGVSDWITSEAEKSILGNASIIKRIYNWIDSELVATDLSVFSDVFKKYGLDKALTTVLFVASEWGEKKGASDLIWLLSKLNSKEFNVIVVGNTRIEEIRNSNHVWIKETHDRTLLANIYGISDVFVNLSREETFGRVSAEAGLNGCEIISYTGTANDEIIKKFDGVICEKKESILDEILRYSSKEKIDNFKKSEAGVDDFDKEKCISEYFDVYKKLSLLNQKTEYGS